MLALVLHISYRACEFSLEEEVEHCWYFPWNLYLPCKVKTPWQHTLYYTLVWRKLDVKHEQVYNLHVTETPRFCTMTGACDL